MIVCGPPGAVNRHIPVTTNARPENRAAESFGTADASRFIHTISAAESARENDSVESNEGGATPPAMNPKFQAWGGGAALSCATTHVPLSLTVGSSALCTEPDRPNNVAEAGLGIAAIAVEAVALSGVMTKARSGASATTG